jgi:group I intron endonuclease
MTGFIYKIYSDKTNLVYIGQTKRTLERRFYEHLKRSEENTNNRKLYNAFQEYGTESFHIKLIETCNIKDLDEREKFWISYYDSYNNGLNATTGGASRPKYNHEEIAERLKQYPYPTKIANEFNCSPDIVREIAQKENITVKNTGNEIFLKKIKAVNQYSKEGKFIKTFNSIADAARYLIDAGYAHSNKSNASGVRNKIVLVAKNKRKTAYGFIWKYFNEDTA